MRIYSLKKRLLLSIGFPVLFSGLLVAFLAFAFAWKEVDEVFDAQMAHMAQVMLDLGKEQIESGDEDKIQLDSETAQLQHSYGRKSAYRIWHNNKLILESSRARNFGQIDLPEGFSNTRILDKPWRFFIFDNKEFRVEISERYAIRYELIGQLVISLVVPALFFLPILLFLVWIGTEKGLKPLVTLSGAVDNRKADDLSPIELERAPREVAPLIQAMNRLFVRTGESFKREREFTDHAAHELRTPLAAMKTQTQVLMKKAASMPESKEGFENLNASIDRASHLLEQLLSLSRLQNEKFPMQELDLSELVQDVLEDMSVTIRSKHQTIVKNIEEHVLVSGHEHSLGIMVRNILDNAFKYTPPHEKVDVTLTKQEFIVADSGHGIGDENKARAFQRFTRFDKTGQTGTGLGLSIVQWIAQSHGATVGLEDNVPSGLIVRVQWAKT